MASTNKNYTLSVKIAGSVASSFNKSISTAEKKLGGLGGVAAKAAKIAAAAWSTLKIGEAISDSVQAAVDFESSMADVAKVVDGLRDENGNLTESYYEMSDSIIEMSKNIPMTATELAQITAAAGTAGIALDELSEFTETAAKMGVAFDTTAEQAGDWMAKWRTSFKMSQTEVTALADQINYLSNNSAATASQISTVVTSVGPLGEVAGISAAQIAALSSAMVGVGVQEDVAATGIKKMATVMTAGEAATAKQAAVLEKLGMNATEMAERMQTDAQGAILDFLDAVSQLPEAEQAAALKNYFGQESVGAIAPLLTNLDVLKTRFDMVADAEQYAGSMEKEYAARAATSANNIQLFQNRIEALKISLGNYLLPVLNDVLAVASDALEWIDEKMSAADNKFTGFFSMIEEAITGATSKLQSNQGAFDGVISYITGTIIPTLADAIVRITPELITLGITLAKELISGLAKGLVEAAPEIITRLPEFLSGIYGALTDGFGNMGGTIVSALIGKKVIKGLTSSFTTLKGTVTKGLNIFKKLPTTIGNVSDALAKVGPALSKAGKFFLGLNPKVLLTVGVIAALITIGILVYKNWDKIKAWLIKIWTAIKTAAVNIWTSIKNAIVKTWETIKSKVENAANNVKTTVVNIWESIKSKTLTIWENIKAKIVGVWNNIKSAVSGAVNAVKSTVVSVWSSISSTTSSIWESIKSAISSKIDAAKNAVSTAISKIKGFMSFTWSLPSVGVTILETMKTKVRSAINYIKGLFNFTWSLPSIKLPHFYIASYKEILGAKIPQIGVSWYKQGGILDGAQIFGAAGGNLLGGGEAGKEAVLPLSELWKNMRTVMTEVVAGADNSSLKVLADRMDAALSGSGQIPAADLLAAFGGKDKYEKPEPNDGPVYRIVFSPQYQFFGGAPSKQDMTDAAKMSQEDFNAMMNQWVKDNARKSF